MSTTEQIEHDKAEQPSKRLFFVLFEDTGTEKDNIVSDNAETFYKFSKEAFAALEVCETETLPDEMPETEKSGVQALAVFEVAENTDLSAVQKLSLSQFLLPALIKDAEPEKSLTASAE